MILGFDFIIEPKNTRKNKGLRATAQLCLNSLWGKFGQRRSNDEYTFCKSWAELMTINNGPTLKTKSWNIVSENCVEMMFIVNSDMDAEADFTNEAVAAFTTANARMRLYSMLEWLSLGQLAYCDTDSCVFLCDHDNRITSRRSTTLRICRRV